MDDGRNLEVLEAIHMNIHALRLIPNYKPSIFEFKVSKLIAERYSFKCKECREKLEQYKNTPEQKNKPGIMSRIKDAVGETE